MLAFEFAIELIDFTFCLFYLFLKAFNDFFEFLDGFLSLI